MFAPENTHVEFAANLRFYHNLPAPETYLSKDSSNTSGAGPILHFIDLTKGANLLSLAC